MAQARRPPPPDSEIAALMSRRDALRLAAGLPDAELRPSLDAALAELDGAIDALARARGERGQEAGSELSPDAQAEKRQLQATFRDTPVPLFVLGQEGTVRRVNGSAAEFLGTHTGYATGKPFTAFVNFPSRASVQTQLAAVSRTGTVRRFRCELLTAGEVRDCELTAAMTEVRGDAGRIIVVVGEAPATATTPASAGRPGTLTGPGPAATITSMTRRLELATAVTRVLFESIALNEAVAVERCARLLAGELGAWAIVDVARGKRLYRQFVVGPGDQQSADLARVVADHDPDPGSFPSTVHHNRRSMLIAHVDDASLLGEGPDGVPLLMLAGATCLLGVPLAEGERSYGTLTLARPAGTEPFGMADLGLVEELGEQIALAVTMGRMVRRQTMAAEALHASLLPRDLPTIPGVEIAATHRGATEVAGAGGDFHDVYRSRTGWGLTIGEGCGRGGGVPAVSAAARHAIRVAAHSRADPAAVLSTANQIVLAEEFGGRFVTACAAHMRWRGRSLHVTVASAGHPAPVVVRPDGRAHRMSGGGLPLGLFPDSDPAVEDCDLYPGDVLVCFTDGLVNARGPEMDCFEDRLTGEIVSLAGRPPGEMVARLADAAMDLCQGEPRDDFTVMAVRAGERPGSPARAT